MQLKVVPARKCPKRDVISALDIYCRTVDVGSMTDTNQISEYIWNPKNHQSEPRQMFFYLLYDCDDKVEGFAEFAYLPENQVLVLDYLCTGHRNHVLFYNFYHMVIQDIEAVLKKTGLYIRYILTGLSLTNVNGQLTDVDSNYYRHLLSNEDYRLLKYPYYQPPLLPQDEVKEFNLAITFAGSYASSPLIISKQLYLSIVKELYYSHYLDWYNRDPELKSLLDELIKKIEREIVENRDSDPVSLVQCRLFDEGQCPKISAENVTLQRRRSKKLKAVFAVIAWVVLASITFVVCIIPELSRVVTVLCSFMTIIAGAISIISLRNDIFGT